MLIKINEFNKLLNRFSFRLNCLIFLVHKGHKYMHVYINTAKVSKLIKCKKLFIYFLCSVAITIKKLSYISLLLFMMLNNEEMKKKNR